MALLSAKPKKPRMVHRERVEVVTPKPKPRLLPPAVAASVRSQSSSSSRASPKPKLLPRHKSASPYPSSSDDRRAERKRKHGSADPLQPHFDKDSDGEDEDDDVFLNLESRKRRRPLDDHVDKNRTLTCADAFDVEKPRRLNYIHATEIMNSTSTSKAVERALGAGPDDDIRVELQYPSLYAPEKYELLVENGKIDAVRDIIDVVSHVADEYLTEEQAVDFREPKAGLIRRLKRASGMNELSSFKEALRDANDKILSLANDGTFRKNLDTKNCLPRKLVEFILTQVYDRTVSPDVEKLKQYTNGTDNVYGELNYVFISKILQEKTRMTSDQVFVDLGSGVGNVVLQAALEIGCESWGCEMMDNPCDFAEAQKKEFAKRCRLWGLAPGKVNLVRGDFLQETSVHDVLKRADVVLVNNQAFTPQLNDKLVSLFLDLKKGCKIVSLKSFLYDQGVRSINDVASNILQVEDHTYPEGHVSWTNAGGTFCISTRK